MYSNVDAPSSPLPPGTYVVTIVLYMRSKAWLVARMPLQLTRPPCTASSAQRSRRLRPMRVAAPVLLVHAEVIEFCSIGQNVGTSLWLIMSACWIRIACSLSIRQVECE